MLCYGALVAVIHAVAVPGTPAPAAAGFGPAVRALPAGLVAAAIFLVVTTLGTMAFFIPGAYLWGMWQLWLVALVVERIGPLASLRRSWHLMVGAWWRISTLITLALIVIFALAVVGYLIMGSLLLVVGVNLERATAAMTIMEAIGNLLLAPLMAAAFVVVLPGSSCAHRRAAPREEVWTRGWAGCWWHRPSAAARRVRRPSPACRRS